MRPSLAARLLSVLALALAGLILPPPAKAPAQGMLRGPVVPDDAGRRQPRPPPALPGLTGRRAAPVIPADPAAGALAPNEALFDAISRGDLPAAREAIARGADIDARNVLGLTPIDSAVDQGRSEIMFYLLSVRGAARGGSGPPEQPRQPTPAERRAAEAAARREAAAAEAAARRRAPNAAPLTPRLWANDGGAPIPAIGFLGFDAGRPAGGGPELRSRSAGRPGPQGRG